MQCVAIAHVLYLFIKTAFKSVEKVRQYLEIPGQRELQ